MTELQDGIAPTIITHLAKNDFQFSITIQRTTNLSYSLWRAVELDGLAWSPLTNVVMTTNGAATVTLTDTNMIFSKSFYRVVPNAP